MITLRRLTWLLLVAGAASQHVHLEIPEVEKVVNSALSKFHAYTSYHGPTGAANASLPKASSASFKANVAVADPPYWLANVAHQGTSAFNNDKTYKVFRNVKDYGAKGDGVTDDTAAIQNAISSGNRCGPTNCQSSTLTPAVVYFPAGTYVVSGAIIDYYYTQIIGNPNSLPILKASPGFSGSAMIDGDPYLPGGRFGSTNVFYRQIRNLIFDLTAVPANSAATAIHWPTAQATSIQNVQINLSQNSGTQHQGIFVEDGSGGFMNDITIHGGLYGFNIGNQQFTLRNIQISNAITAINQIWSWGFTYKGLTVTNCSVALDMSSGGRTGQSVGSVAIIDSTFTNTPVGVRTAHDSTSSPPTAGSLILENVQLSNVPVAVQGPNGATALAGGTTTINGWGEGHEYTPNGPTNFEGSFSPAPRPGALLESGNKYYELSKPQYASTGTGSVISLRSSGAKGDGVTDDTTAVQNAITQGASQGKLVFFDAGTYKVTNTIYVPPGSQIVGESFSVIMSSGSRFANINSPIPVVQVGHSGESGKVQWSDMIVSTQGAQPGATLIEWNLAASSGSGMWDVHTRIGGFAGSNLQVAQCPTSQTSPSANCLGAYMSMHVTKTASGVYLENCWLWTADHDLDSGSSTQISVYTGRGLLVEASSTVWLYGTGVEHHSLYQYQFSNTHFVFAGFIQTETPYWQPTPDAKHSPYPPVTALNDPTFASCTSGNCDAWGARITGSQNVFIYGAGLYSFFNTYSTTCSNGGGPENCQSQIFDVENSGSIFVYNLATIGSQSMAVVNGASVASYSDNVNVFPDLIALFRTG